MLATLVDASLYTSHTGRTVLKLEYVLDTGETVFKHTVNHDVLMAVLKSKVPVEPSSFIYKDKTYPDFNFVELM